MTLGGRRVVVTGAARGIGEAAVDAFVEAGDDVVAMDVRDEAGAAVAARATERGPGTARYVHVDVGSRASVEGAFAVAVEHLGGLDALVHAAGVELFAAPEEIGEHELDVILDVNVRGTVFTNQAAFRCMAGRGGVILNFGSDAALIPYPDAAHYSASKGAVASWTRSVAAAWGGRGVRVNTIVPAMWTPMYDAHRALMTPDELRAHDQAMAATIPLGGRLGDPRHDLAPVLEFLIGDGARFITGQLISVNGGAVPTR